MNEYEVLKSLIDKIKTIPNIEDVIFFQELENYTFPEEKIVIILDVVDKKIKSFGNARENIVMLHACIKADGGYKTMLAFDDTLRDELSGYQDLNIKGLFLHNSKDPYFDNKYQTWSRTIISDLEYWR